MTYKTGIRSAVCFAALMAGGAAQADVTAAQVWEDWKAQLEIYGEDGVSIGAEETSSGTVTVRDLELTFSDEDVAIETNIGDIVFNEQSDGTVQVTMADSFPMTMTVEDGTIINILVSQSNFEMIVSGDPEAMNYDLSADEYKIAFQDAINGDVTIGGEAALTASNLEARYEMTLGEMRDVSYNVSIDLLDLLVDFEIPGADGEYITAAAKYNNMSTQGEMSMPLDMSELQPEEIMASGMTLSGGYIVESSDFVIDINADGDQLAASGSSGEVTFTGGVSETAVAYDTAAKDLNISVRTSEFPLPIDVSMAEYGIGFEMPTAPTDEAAPMGISFDIIDLAISDGIWDLFDPDSVLPRDPATVQLSLQGTAKAMMNIMDPDDQMAMAMGGGNPFEPETLALETLNIDVAGATVTGEGSFTFDNEDMQSFAPMPRPEGDAAIQINGLNALLDNLVMIGLVPAEEVMGPRMMMGMFARSTGDDQMEIGVEVNKAGEVLVNGNRVR